MVLRYCFLLASLIGVIISKETTFEEDDDHELYKNPTPFSNYSWFWALGCLIVLLSIRQFVKNQAHEKLEINVVDEMRKRDGVYRKEEYEADAKNGVLQTNPQDEDGCIKLKLSKRTKINHDTFQFRYFKILTNYRFDFPSKNQEFGMPIGGYVVFYATVKNSETGKEEEIGRKYTPTSEVHQKGYVEFIIKVYRAGENPRFPHGGLMTQYLEKLPAGEFMKIEGPKGKLSYLGHGNFYISKKYHIKKNIGMVAGGSGITPSFQIIQAVVKNRDSIKLHLLYGNKSEKDIIIREELEQLHEDYPDHFELTYIIDKAEHPDTWKYETGYITEEILKKYMPEEGEDTLIVTCGPPIMNELVKKFLPNHMIHKF